MRTAKDLWIELVSSGVPSNEIDDELLCRMMDEERESIELAHENSLDQLEKGGGVCTVTDAKAC